MKASDILSVNCELYHKSRTEEDLIRHIQTREGGLSNYNLLMGAGCSVTSGIRTAQKLIDEWTLEIYKRYKNKSAVNVGEAREYLEKEHASWYSTVSPYSSLFEKKFDLPSQRRRFVEQEVDEKLPSIGYSYLISLIKENYFSNIFTTNFDDLINEAFYQFSSVRPIHCAHDSSIHSISITSKRPKIIKLHGDYLFDDIKSTLKETESLEQNTKEKLVEFCKEYGLIVVGYSGNDRSIMDTIEFLIKQDNYLKNGIYWCLRKDDEICHSLRNLLWKEKVYPVIIDGFDEFFANCHRSLIGRGLDIRPNNKESKLQKTIKNILEDSFYLSDNKVIGQDIYNLKNESSKQDISEFLTNIDKDENGDSDVGITDLRNLLEVDSIRSKNDIQAAYDLCESFFRAVESEDVKSQYISKLISLSNLKNDKTTALKWANQLIDIDKNNIGYHLLKADCLEGLNERKEYLKEKALYFSHNYGLYNRAAEISFELLETSPASNVSEKDVNNIIELTDISLSLEPSLSNDAWSQKIELLNKKKKIKANSTKVRGLEDSDIAKEISDFYNDFLKVNKYHIRTLEVFTSKVINDAPEDEIFAHLVFLKEAYEKSTENKRRRILFLENKVYYSFLDKEMSQLARDKVDIFYRQDFPKKVSPFVLLSQCEYFYGVLGDKANALALLDKALEKQNIGGYLDKVLNLSRALNPDLIGRIEELLISNFGAVGDSYYYYALMEIELEKGNYDEALVNIEKSYFYGMEFNRYLTGKSYCLLKAGMFSEVLSLFKEYRSSIVQSDFEAFSLNCQYAAKELGDSIYNEVDIRNIYNKTKDKGVEICARYILGEKSKAMQLVKKEILKNRFNYYLFKRWPILSTMDLSFSEEEKPE